MRRSGLTLLELVLVLAILVVIASFSAATIGGLLGDRRLRRGADQVRVAFAEARLEAMRSGRTQMVRCQIGGSQYALEPVPEASDLTEAADQIGRGNLAMAGGGAGAIAASSSAALAEPTDVKEVPEKILFETAQAVATAREWQATNSTTGAAAVARTERATMETSWSQPILFFADGTTSTAEVVVSNAAGRQLAIRLRSLTGDAMVVDR
jgi:prepilin-type N-terminal cleavage/methylation domain-containing protein